MKRVIPFLILIILAAAISYGISSYKHSEQPLPRPCSLESLSEYLSLSPEQQDKMRPMFVDLASERTEIINDRDTVTRRLVQILKSDNTTDQQINAALKAVDIEQSKLRSLTAHHLMHLKSVLNKDQRDKLFDLVNKRLCVGDGQGSLACPVEKPN
ncbi:MAG: Spy/CpxP family protein refolding chaperone [Armatimonadota bacterium]